MQTSGGRAFVPHAASLSPSHTAHLDDLLHLLPARHVLLVLDLAVHAPRVPGERLDGALGVSSSPHRACLCCLGGCSLAVWRGWRHRDTLEAVLGAEGAVGVRQCGAKARSSAETTAAQRRHSPTRSETLRDPEQWPTPGHPHQRCVEQRTANASVGPTALFALRCRPRRALPRRLQTLRVCECFQRDSRQRGWWGWGAGCWARQTKGALEEAAQRPSLFCSVRRLHACRQARRHAGI